MNHETIAETRQAAATADKYDGDPADYVVPFVAAGTHDDINPEAGQ